MIELLPSGMSLSYTCKNDIRYTIAHLSGDCTNQDCWDIVTALNSLQASEMDSVQRTNYFRILDLDV